MNPHTFRYQILSLATNSRNGQAGLELREGQSGEVPTVVPSPAGVVSGPVLPPDLAFVVAAWDCLSDAIKAGILAIVQAASGGSNA